MKHIFYPSLFVFLLLFSFIVKGQESDDPVNNYYTVYLPPVEGGWTQPSEGRYEVREGEPFDFTLYVREDYDGSAVKVNVNGDILYALPDPTDRSIYFSAASVAYKYKIQMVREPIRIDINGLTLNDPTGIGTLGSTPNIYSENSILFIETSHSQIVYVYSITGRLMIAQTVNGLESFSLGRGIYLVKVGEEAFKAVVR